ncbi:entericidin A/B family lipoprotein [Neptunicella sp. SCSIO 80796]|uniref:entericidin A/B family lipoprotein n=1 Tax=Neptunicella plasticusilytica TaxID=3117012 RepID=UPI003A4D2FC3
MKAINKKSFVHSTLLLLVLIFGVSACATVEGAGKDIESAGEAVQEAATDD